MQHIETVTVGSGGAASITFMAVGEIPSTFTDLVVLYSVRSTRAAQVDDPVEIYFNNSSVSYSNRTLRGNGSSVVSDQAGSPSDIGGGFMPAASATANTFGNGTLYIPNYRSSAFKSTSVDFVHENNATLGIQTIAAGLWSVTDAIVEIKLQPQIATFAEHSTASLYGITAGSDGVTTVS